MRSIGVVVIFVAAALAAALGPAPARAPGRSNRRVAKFLDTLFTVALHAPTAASKKRRSEDPKGITLQLAHAGLRPAFRG